MPVSDEFLEYILDQMSRLGGVTARRMFGGAGIFRDGRMFALIADDVAYLKADDSNRGAFTDVGSSPFKPDPGKAFTMPYYEIPPDVLERPDELAEWSKRSLAIPGSKRPKRGCRARRVAGSAVGRRR